MPASAITINLAPGKTHVITLKGRATTGYEWMPVFSKDGIADIQKEFVAATKKEKPLAGESADEQFTITALRAGKTTLHITQQRAWETNEKPADEKKYIIVVK
jgi:predicted secreted protein